MKEMQTLIDAAKEEYGANDKEKDLYDFSWDVFQQTQELVIAAQNKDLETLKSEIGNTMLTLFVLQHFCEHKHGIELTDTLNKTIKKINERKPRPKEQKITQQTTNDDEIEVLDFKAMKKKKK